MESRLNATEKQAAQPKYIPQPSEGGGGSFLQTEQGLTMSGFIDTSYTYNFNRPDERVGPGATNSNRIFDTRDSSFHLHALEFDFEKLAPADGGVGFRADLVYGLDPFVTNSAGFVADEFGLQQAYAEINVPINGGSILGDNVNIQVGKFVTLAGNEVIESMNNMNFSRSFAFGLTIPFTHSGIRTNWSVMDGKVDLSLGVNNGWDNVTDNNTQKTLELGVGFEPVDGLSYYGTVYYGGEQAGDDGQRRFLNTNVLTWETPIENLTSVVEFNVGNERKVPGLEGRATSLTDATWWSTNLYLKYDINEKTYVAWRGEWFIDDDRFRTGAGTQGAREYWGSTWTVDYRPWEDLITRFEIRWDKADARAFDTSVGAANATESSQTTLGAEVIYMFG
jgi:hypothetical protein